MRTLFPSLLAIGILAGLSACDSTSESQKLSSLADENCGSFTPGLIQYEVFQGDETVQGFAAVTQDHLCQTRYVKIDGCGSAKEAMQFTGFFQTKPRLLNASSPDYDAFIEQVEGDGTSGDFQRLPHLSCTAGSSFPLEPIREGTFVVGDSSNLGRSSFVAKTEAKGQIVYSFPTMCLRMQSFFDLDRLFLDDRVKVLDELPRLGPNDSEIRLDCGYERPTPVEKDVWRIFRIRNSASSVFYLLRYAAGQADEAVELLITRVDGQKIKSANAALEASLQKTFQRSIEIPDFSLDFTNGALDRPLLDICLNTCGNFIPVHEVLKKKVETWWPHEVPQSSVTKETYRQDLSVLPDGQAMDTISLPSGKKLSFSSCSIGARFGFLPSGKAVTSFEEWQDQVRNSILHQTANPPLQTTNPLLVPCPGPQADVCRVSIPANTNLSATMATNDGISQLIADSRKKPECAKATTLRLELQGEAIVSGTAWTIGNSSSQSNPYRNIQLIGRAPEAALVQKLSCGDKCGKSDAPVLRIVGDATMSLQGFKIRTESTASSVRTLALVREEAAGSLMKLHLRNVTIGDNAKPFHTGIRLRGGLSFFHDLNLQAYFRGIKADSSLLSVTGSRAAGPLLPTGAAQITVLDIGAVDASPDLGETFYRDTDGIAIQAVNSRGLVFLTKTRAPRGWSLGVGTQFAADFVDLANSNNLLKDISRAFVMADYTSLDIGSLKVQNYASLLYFTGVAIAQSSVRTGSFIKGSYTTSPANFIINRQSGLINFEAETGSEKGLSCVEDVDAPGLCLLGGAFL